MTAWILIIHLFSGDLDADWFEPFGTRKECTSMITRLKSSGYLVDMECKSQRVI